MLCDEYACRWQMKGYNISYLKDKTIEAEQRGHATAEQAAQIAKMANAKRMMLGHYSSRYNDLMPFLDEAKAIFENTILAIEGETTVIDFA